MPSVTLAEIQSRVYTGIDNNSGFWPLAEVTRAINESVRVLNLFTGFQQSTVTLSGGTQANRVFYNVPNTILFPLEVYIDGRQLSRSTFRGTGMLTRRWLQQNSAGYGPVAHWVPIGITKFALHPADSKGGRVLTMDGVIEPTALASASDIIQMEDEFTDAVVDMSVYTLQLKEGGKPFADASLRYQSFLSRMKEMTRWRDMKMPRYWVEVEATKAA